MPRPLVWFLLVVGPVPATALIVELSYRLHAGPDGMRGWFYLSSPSCLGAVLLWRALVTLGWWRLPIIITYTIFTVAVALYVELWIAAINGDGL